MEIIDIVLLSLGPIIAIIGNRMLAAGKDDYIKARQTYAQIDGERDNLHEMNRSYTKLQQTYQMKRQTIKRHEEIIGSFNIGIGSSDPVIYTRSHNPDDLPDLEKRLEKAISTRKTMVKEKRAAICRLGDDIQINGRKASAKTMINREIRLRLRCLDSEVDSAIALADWNNINRLNSRVRNAFSEINKRGKIIKIEITPRYLDIRLEELNLSYEVAQLKKDIKEEEREAARIVREAEREEARLKATSEQAIAERERMEKLVQQELSKLEHLNEEQRALLAEHQEELALLRQREVRATSMAQITRAGFVYIISNVMSFGDGVIKIGMTRRLDPNERVHELGDASVPDTFDVHAFFYSEDAPALEHHLHKQFAEKQVNLVNSRKEFFYLDPEIAIQAALKAPISAERTQ